MTELLGVCGSILLAACALPQVIKTIETRSASDFDWNFLVMWLAGDALMLSYSVSVCNIILILNYATNLIPICIIIYIKLLYSDIK